MPASRDEGRSIEGFYEQSILLSGREASRKQVLARWRSADVLHFATHALVDEALPASARLILASDGGNLTMNDVAATRFDRRPLVVLSACSTRAGRMVPLGGPLDLVHKFIGSGARGVVATLKPVDDRLAARVMISFHREYAMSGDAAAALADALREAQRSSPPNGDWAAFQYVGSDPATLRSLPESIAHDLAERGDR